VARYVLKRLLGLVPLLLAIYTLVFFLMRLMPGGPWEEADRPLPPAVVENLRAKYKADAPLWQQYTDYLVGIVTRFDFGPSYRNASRSVNEIFADFLPVSLQLGTAAMLLALAIGLPLGILAAIHHNTWLDHLAMLVAMAGISVPNYVMAAVLILLFASTLRLVPTSGWDGIFSTQALIPAFALAFGPAGRLARYARAAMLEVIGQDYVRTARAKGLRGRVIVLRHALKNAMIPVLTVAGVQLAFVLMGSFFVEVVCGVPGIGRYFVLSVTGRDYPVIMGTVLLMAVVISVVNLLVDLSYAYLDPRIRLS
jgi:ABC-type dipeptide/oligopeptide/nickel transport system permease component